MKPSLLRRILALSIPAIIANIATPLMSMSDMAIAGRMGSADFMASVALGGVIFNLLYWLLGFLRMGTSGLTANSAGAADDTGVVLALARSLFIALLTGLLIVVFQTPVISLLLQIMGAEGSVVIHTQTYCRICIWGAPAVLVVTAFSGWYAGLQNSRLPMIVSLVTIAFNIALSVTLVFVCGMKVEGVAFGTLAAQYFGAGLFVLSGVRRLRFRDLRLREVFDIQALTRFLSINADIFLRTLCMVAVTFWFTRTGTVQGAVVLAANALIMQMFTMFSYFMDGFAYAAEGICGYYYGSCRGHMLRQAAKMLYAVGAIMAVAFSAAYFVGSDVIVRLLSADEAVNEAAMAYFAWAVAVPVAGFAAFIGDGIAVGLIKTRLMLGSLLLSTACFFLVYTTAYPVMGNDGLWLAFVVYLAVRGVFLLLTLPRSFSVGKE